MEMRTDTETGGGAGALRASVTFEGTPSNVRVARTFTTRLADLVLAKGRQLDQTDQHALALMVSELVTNAVEHGVGPVSLVLLSESDCLRVEITDRSAEAPIRRYSMPGALSGRGLEIVERLALAWGWEPLPDGKKVWFTY
jgi:anti-sigma regulatory factor (Ser/Thr protein kinase)